MPVSSTGHGRSGRLRILISPSPAWKSVSVVLWVCNRMYRAYGGRCRTRVADAGSRRSLPIPDRQDAMTDSNETGTITMRCGCPIEPRTHRNLGMDSGGLVVMAVRRYSGVAAFPSGRDWRTLRVRCIRAQAVLAIAAMAMPRSGLLPPWVLRSGGLPPSALPPWALTRCTLMVSSVQTERTACLTNRPDTLRQFFPAVPGSGPLQQVPHTSGLCLPADPLTGSRYR